MYGDQCGEFVRGFWGLKGWLLKQFIINPFAPGDFAEKRVLKVLKWFSGHCPALKS